jgi:hypothetical protein
LILFQNNWNKAFQSPFPAILALHEIIGGMRIEMQVKAGLRLYHEKHQSDINGRSKHFLQIIS